MKKKTQNGHADKLKENIEQVSKQSKETIREIIDSSSRQFESVLDANKRFIESLEKQVFNKDVIDGSIISEIKKSFSSSVELSEEAIDTIIDLQSDQLQSSIDFNTKLIEAVKNLDITSREDVEELLGFIRENFEKTSNKSIENTKKMTELYNKHVNLAVNFNDRFSRNISNQLQTLNRFSNKNMEMFNDWATQWWKSSSKEEAAV